MVTTFSLLLITFTRFLEATAIANRSPQTSRNVEESSPGYGPSRNTLSIQHLGYHYGYQDYTTVAPFDIVQVDSEYNKNIFTSNTISNGLIEVEKSRPVYEIIEDEYSSPHVTESPIRIHSTVKSLVSPSNIKNLKYHHDTKANAVSTAITTLDWLLENKGYNSPIHPPPSPVIALVLSHYGRYLPITRGPRVYSYMAVNNIHNHQPFGQYKWETDGNG